MIRSSQEGCGDKVNNLISIQSQRGEGRCYNVRRPWTSQYSENRKRTEGSLYSVGGGACAMREGGSETRSLRPNKQKKRKRKRGILVKKRGACRIPAGDLQSKLSKEV